MNIVSAETIALAGRWQRRSDASPESLTTGLIDLSFILAHVDTATSVTIFDRPGVPLSSVGNRSDFNGTYAFGSGYSSNFETDAEGNRPKSDPVKLTVPSANYLPEGSLQPIQQASLPTGPGLCS